MKGDAMQEIQVAFCGLKNNKDDFPRRYKVNIRCKSVSDVFVALSEEYTHIQHLQILGIITKKPKKKKIKCNE